MSYEDKPHYARLYRKGKKVGKIFEANPLYEFRNRAERIADQEEVRLLSGFGYWWHDKIRLRWAKALLFITCLSSGQWTAIGTVGLVVVGVLQYMNMTNSDGVNTDTPQKQEQIDAPSPPLVRGRHVHS